MPLFGPAERDGAVTMISLAKVKVQEMFHSCVKFSLRLGICN